MVLKTWREWEEGERGKPDQLREKARAELALSLSR